MQYSVKKLIMFLQYYWVWVGILLLLIIVSVMIITSQRRLIVKYKASGVDSNKLKRRYTEFVHLLPQTVVELNREGGISFLNKAGYDFLGLNKYDIEKGVNINQLIVAEHRARFHQDYMYILEGGLNKGQEYSISSQKGTKYSIMIYFNPIVNNNQIDGVRGIMIDVSRSKKLERQAFLAVIDTEERERKRYSEDLHDGLGPLLSTIKLYINQMNHEKASYNDRKYLLNYTNDLIDEAISTTRTIANNILPTSIGDNGLWAAIQSFCNNIEKTGAMKFVLVNNTNIKYKSKAENNIYRIIIELINNTLKHAKAHSINISFEMQNDNIRIIYSDDGVGIIAAAHQGLGLRNIKNRSSSLNGQYHFSNSKGMRFDILIPMNEIVE